MSLQENIWRETIAENIPSLEQLFSSRAFKKVLVPFLRAQREVKLRTVLQSKDHMEMDVARGMALGFEQILNLPSALQAYKKNLAEAKTTEVPEDSVYSGEETLDFDED